MVTAKETGGDFFENLNLETEFQSTTTPVDSV